MYGDTLEDGETPVFIDMFILGLPEPEPEVEEVVEEVIVEEVAEET